MQHALTQPETQADATSGRVATLAIPTGRIACSRCTGVIEERLRQNPHVVGVHVDAAHQVAHVQVHEGKVAAEELSELICSSCGGRNPVPLPDAAVSAHAHAHTADPRLRQAHLRHAPSIRAWCTPSTTCPIRAWPRRWKPTCAAGSGSAWSLGIRWSPTPGLASTARASRAADAVWRPARLGHAAFATPVALWTSSVFHIGRLLRAALGVLNMSVLVSLGILTSYLFSVGLTLLRARARRRSTRRR